MEDQNNIESNASNNEEPQLFDVSFSIGKQKFSRRKFVEAAAITSAAATLAGCIPGASLGPIPLGPTFTQTSTATRTPTNTSTPTPTMTSTPTNTPIPDVIMLVNTQGTVFRTGPDEDYPGITSLSIGVPIHLNGRLYDDSWYRGVIAIEHMPDIADQTLSEIEGWIRADLLNTLEGDPSVLPVIDEIDIPPAPTELPNTPVPAGDDGIEYSYTDAYGNVQTYTLPCGADVPDGAVCTCNCVSTCSCVGYVAPSCSCNSHSSSCSCNLVSYWYPN